MHDPSGLDFFMDDLPMRKLVFTAFMAAFAPASNSTTALAQTLHAIDADSTTEADVIPVTLAPVTVQGNVPSNSTLALHAPQQTGSRLGLTPYETPASISVMDSASIAEQSLGRAQDVPVRLPGIAQAPTPGNGGTALIARGFLGHNSVAQLIDGTRQVVALASITYPFSTWPFESVQVLHGPASVVYGDGAIGAAVNYVTKKPLWDETRGEAFVTAGPNGLVQGGVGVRGPVNDVLAYSIWLDGERSDGWRALEDVRRRNWSLALSARPGARLLATLALDGGVNDDARYFGTPLRNGALDKSLRRVNYNVGDAVVRHDDRMWRASVQYDVNARVQLRNETYHTTSDRHWRNAERYRFNAAGTAVIRDDYIDVLHDQMQTGNRFEAVLDTDVAGRRLRTAVGFDWTQAKFLHTSNSPYGGVSTVDPRVFDRGGFDSPDALQAASRRKLHTRTFFMEQALDVTTHWKLVGGLRHAHMRLHDHNLRNQQRRQIAYRPTTGRIGVVWAPTGALSLYGQFATATDPVSGSLALPGGRTDFDLTRGRQVEMGIKGMLPSVNGEWTGAVYRIEKRNLLTRHPDNPGLVQQVGGQSSTGLELAFAAAPTSNWRISANLAVLRAKYDDFTESVGGAAVSRSGKVPRGVPEHMANLWTSWRVAPQWKAGGGLHHVGKRPSNTANSRWLPAYTLLDAFVSWDWSRDATTMLSVKNLTDRVYALSGSDTSWLLGPSRTVLLSVRAKF